MREWVAFYSPIIISFPVSLYNWTMNFTNIFPVFLPPQSGLESDIFFPSGEVGSDNSSTGQAMVNWLLLRSGLLRNNRMLWYISDRFLCSSPCWKHKGIFLQYLLWKPSGIPWGKSHNIMGVFLRLGLLGVFNSQSCPH